MLKTRIFLGFAQGIAYHLGEGHVLKTGSPRAPSPSRAYHLGEGRVLKTVWFGRTVSSLAYHLGEGRVLKTIRPLV